MNWKDITIKQVRKFFHGTVGKLRMGAILLSGFLYFFLIDFYDKNLNISDYICLTTDEYKIYSGRNGGMYFDVGSGVSELDKKKGWFKSHFFDINVKNVETNGGYENPLSVLTNDNSFGFVEDDIYSGRDFIRQQLNYVSPLYLERLHIIFKRNDTIKEISISANTDENVLRFLSNNIISTGPIGGGTKIIASYIVNELNNQIKEINKNKNEAGKIKLIGDKIVNFQISEGYYEIKKDTNGICVMFLVAGTPLKGVDTLLNSPKFGLASIEPSLTSEINRKYQLDLRITDFKRVSDRSQIYPNIEKDKIATFGTYCYLITSKETPPKDIKKFLEKLKLLETEKGNELPLEEFKFLDIYDNSQSNSYWIIVRNFVIFIVSVFISAIGIVTFSVWGISKLQHDSHIDDLERISNDIPNNRLPEGELNKYYGYLKLNDEEKNEISEYLQPEIKENQVSIISTKIIPSIHKLIEKRDKLTDDLSEGILTNEHYSFLMNKVDDLINKFRKSLFYRLHEIIERGNINKPAISILQKYCTAEYLNMDDYDNLKTKYK